MRSNALDFGCPARAQLVLPSKLPLRNLPVDATAPEPICIEGASSCEYKMDIYIRKKSICLTGDVPDVAFDGSVDYSDTNSDESDIDFKVEYKLEKQLAGDL